MSKGIAFENKDGAKLTIGIVSARWNSHITEQLLAGCIQALRDAGVTQKNILTLDVPGSFELVFGARTLIKKGMDAVVCLGVLIKGETKHFEYISSAVAHGIMQLNLSGQTPVVFGVLTCLTEAQALARATGNNNLGLIWGRSAVAMAIIAKV